MWSELFKTDNHSPPRQLFARFIVRMVVCLGISEAIGIVTCWRIGFLVWACGGWEPYPAISCFLYFTGIGFLTGFLGGWFVGLFSSGPELNRIGEAGIGRRTRRPRRGRQQTDLVSGEPSASADRQTRCTRRASKMKGFEGTL